ncbi:MAG: PP2C family protein-serine/threonine phosphatase [Flavobacteriales bacterium]|jgi:sigma-B regulation protein RsbU (phosphoserine phosphatase)|nr:PP2C family protein-serine/threonine phosphatase [Flavobacteriales bacterium]
MARLQRIIERLELKEFQLRALLDVTKAINNNMDRAELLALYEGIMRDDLGITRLMLFERTDRMARVLSFGGRPDDPEPDGDQLMGGFTDIQVIGSGSAGSLGAFDVAVPVFHREKPLALLLIGDIDEDEHGMSPAVKHLNFVQTLTNLIVVAMENQRLVRQALHQERARRELELAAEMQSMLVPRELPDNERIQAAAWYQPHSEVGGDYYDLVPLPDDRLLLCIADVSGKGIAAALLMSNLQANLRAMAGRAAHDLPGFVEELNRRVGENARGERFVTLFVGHINLRDRTMRYVNAGHNPPLLHHAGHTRELTLGCTPLGMLPTLPMLKVGTVDLPRASVLLCFTDGLVEQGNEADVEFGTDVLQRILDTTGAAGAHAVNHAVKATFEAHRGHQPYLDDTALLTCVFP